MPVCKQRKKYSNCLTVDLCEYCGAKDWDTALFKIGAKTGSGDAFITLIAGAVGIVLYLAIAAAVLWGLVAAVKWMWQHSPHAQNLFENLSSDTGHVVGVLKRARSRFRILRSFSTTTDMPV